MLKMGDVYRYARPYSPDPESIGKFANFFAVTRSQGHRFALVEKGISPIAAVKAPDTLRAPAILISSSPHKTGSKQTPWQDFFDTDNGHIRYFGDAKIPTADPSRSPGNAALLAAYKIQAAFEPEVRSHSVPLIFFERVRRENAAKGFLKFQGYGVVARAELIAQHDQAIGRSFSNYVYDFAVFSLAAENECFDWRWISDRRNALLPIADTLSHAPESWKEWLDEGHRAIFKFTRRIARQRTVPKNDQRPGPASLQESALRTIYEFYAGKKHRFEVLASEVARRILSPSGSGYHKGWITPPSGDGGADFVARVDLGSGFA